MKLYVSFCEKRNRYIKEMAEISVFMFIFYLTEKSHPAKNAVGRKM